MPCTPVSSTCVLNFPAQPSCGARLYQSDKLVSEELNAKLLKAVSFLENVPDAEKDWRAGSNGVVLDLVDPDLFYAVNGRTLRWTTGPDGKWALERLTGISLDRNLGKLSYSTKFSQIPTEFQIGSNGEPAKALGYINNVHPEHGRDLVTVIEALVGRFSILWDRVLTDLHPLNALDLGKPSLSEITATQPKGRNCKSALGCPAFIS